MSAVAVVEPAPLLAQGTDSDDGLVHWYCCNPDVALCGSDISESEPADPDEEVNCVDCNVLYYKPCSPTCDWEEVEIVVIEA